MTLSQLGRSPGLGRLRTGLGRHQTSKSRARTERLARLLPSCSFLVRAAESYAGTAQTVLAVGKARTLPRSSFSQSAYLVITSRRRSTAVILR